eukprot:6548252-Prymnesium_polylepis.1
MVHRVLVRAMACWVENSFWNAWAVEDRDRQPVNAVASVFMCEKQTARGWKAWAAQVRRRHRVAAVVSRLARVGRRMTQRSLA